MRKIFEIPNPFYWLKALFNKCKRKHIHIYYKLVADIAMDNNTNHLVFKCDCGEVEIKHFHRESEFYKSLKRYMKKIPTAEQFLQSEICDHLTDAQRAIEFAKLHVEAALKEASEKATLLNDGEESNMSRYVVSDGNHYSETEIDVSKESILNSYPLDNIK
jgi:hypothetical protein